MATSGVKRLYTIYIYPGSYRLKSPTIYGTLVMFTPTFNNVSYCTMYRYPGLSQCNSAGLYPIFPSPEHGRLRPHKSYLFHTRSGLFQALRPTVPGTHAFSLLIERVCHSHSSSSEPPECMSSVRRCMVCRSTWVVRACEALFVSF